MAHTNLYYGNHVLVKKARGRAREQACEHCDSQAYDWATVHGKNAETEPLSSEDFMPLCRPCHRKYDESLPDWTGRHHTPETIEKIRQAKTGISNHTPESKKKISDANMGRTLSLETRAKIRAAKLARDREQPPRITKHGTASEYRRGCRCRECRDAKRKSR